MKNQIPEEMIDHDEEYVAGMSDGKKAFLAAFLTKVKSETNMFHDNLKANNRSDLIKKYEQKHGSGTKKNQSPKDVNTNIPKAKEVDLQLNLSRNAKEFNLKSLTSRIPESNSRMMFDTRQSISPSITIES